MITFLNYLGQRHRLRALHKATTEKIPALITRSNWAARWDAKDAVLNGMPKSQFLTHRKAIYDEKLPQVNYPLPDDLTVVPDGTLLMQRNPQFDSYPARLLDDTAAADGDPFALEQSRLRALRLGEGQLWHLELAEREERRAEARRVRSEAEARHEELLELRQKEIAASDNPSSDILTLRDRWRARPRIPHGPLVWTCRIAVGLLGLLEASQSAVPCMDLLGVDVTNIGVEVRRNPIAVATGVGMALALSGLLLAVGHFLFQQLHSLFTARHSSAIQRERQVRLALGLGVAWLLTGLVIGTLRHQSAEASWSLLGELYHSHSGTAGTFVFVFATLAVSVLAALLMHKQACLRSRQQPYRRQREAWDSWLNTSRLKNRRHDAALRQSEHLRRRGLSEEAREDRGVRSLHRRVHEEEMMIRELLEYHRRLAIRFSSTRLAAMRRDEYHFDRAARRYGALHLITRVVTPVQIPLLPPARGESSE